MLVMFIALMISIKPQLKYPGKIYLLVTNVKSLTLETFFTKLGLLKENIIVKCNAEVTNIWNAFSSDPLQVLIEYKNLTLCFQHS